MQRDNKIHVLEKKLQQLGGMPKSNQSKGQQPPAMPSAKQREIGKVDKEQAQKQLIDGIKKKPTVAFGSTTTPTRTDKQVKKTVETDEEEEEILIPVKAATASSQSKMFQGIQNRPPMPVVN